MAVKPEPRRCRTWPPSWSAATSRPTPPAAAEPTGLPVSGGRTDRWGPVPGAQQDDPADVLVPQDRVEGRDGWSRPARRPSPADRPSAPGSSVASSRCPQPVEAVAVVSGGGRAGGRAAVGWW